MWIFYIFSSKKKLVIMESENQITRLMRWQYLTGIFFMSAVMMYIPLFLPDEENFCDLCEWKIVLMSGMSYFFMWTTFYLSGILLKGNKAFKYFWESFRGVPRHKIIRYLIVFWVAIVGLIVTFFRAVFNMRDIIRAGRCHTSDYPGMIWQGCIRDCLLH